MSQLKKPPAESDTLAALRKESARDNARQDTYVIYGPRNDAPYSGDDGPRVVVGLLSDGTYGVETWSVDGGRSSIGQAATLVSHTEWTGTVTISATTEGTANAIVTAPTLTSDGDAYYEFEFYAPQVHHSNDGDETVFIVADSGVALGELTDWQSRGTGSVYEPMLLKHRYQPTAGVHTFSIRAYKVGSGTNEVLAEAGGPGNLVPGYLKITKL